MQYTCIQSLAQVAKGVPQSMAVVIARGSTTMRVGTPGGIRTPDLPVRSRTL